MRADTFVSRRNDKRGRQVAFIYIYIDRLQHRGSASNALYYYAPRTTLPRAGLMSVKHVQGGITNREFVFDIS